MAFVLTLGEVRRFRRGKQVASYLGLIPREHSSGGHQRLGSISKQGNRMLRTLLVEAAQSAVQHNPGFRRQYQHHSHHKPRAVAKVAAARKLAIRLESRGLAHSNSPTPRAPRKSRPQEKSRGNTTQAVEYSPLPRSRGMCY